MVGRSKTNCLAMEDSRPLPYTSRLPWIVSVVVTVVSICFDEPPGVPRYYTGYDPGGAAVVSIVFGLWCGWLTLLAMAGPRWLRLGLVVMVTSSFFGYALHKDNLRRPLYVPNADVIDPLVLWAAAGLIGVASVWLTRGWLRLLTVLISVPLAFATSIGFGLAAQAIANDSWNPGWPFFVMLTACRVLVPYFFWTLILPKNLPGERTGPPDLRR